MLCGSRCLLDEGASADAAGMTRHKSLLLWLWNYSPVVKGNLPVSVFYLSYLPAAFIAAWFSFGNAALE